MKVIKHRKTDPVTVKEEPVQPAVVMNDDTVSVVDPVIIEAENPVEPADSIRIKREGD